MRSASSTKPGPGSAQCSPAHTSTGLPIAASASFSFWSARSSRSVRTTPGSHSYAPSTPKSATSELACSRLGSQFVSTCPSSHLAISSTSISATLEERRRLFLPFEREMALDGERMASVHHAGVEHGAANISRGWQAKTCRLNGACQIGLSVPDDPLNGLDFAAGK